MAIDAVSGASLPPPSSSTGAGQPDAADVQQFSQAMDAPMDDTAARALVEKGIRDDVMRKMITDAFALGKKIFGDDD